MVSRVDACGALLGTAVAVGVATPMLVLAAAFSMDSPDSTILQPMGVLAGGYSVACISGAAGGAIIAKATQAALRAFLQAG